MPEFLVGLIALVLIVKGIIGLVDPAYLFTLAQKFQKRKTAVRVASIVSIIIGILLL